MLGNNGLTTADVLEAFRDEIATHRGTVADTFEDGSRLFARAVLPRLDEVEPGDRLQAGVALKASEQEVCLHLYVFRLVCSNGAIMAQSGQAREITGFDEFAPDEAIANLREAVRANCAPEIFTDAVKQIRASRDRQADMMLTMMPMLSRMPHGFGGRILQQIMDQFFAAGDKSQFGLMNAVTAVARDTADPEVRWNLEELGGAMPIVASNLKPRPNFPARARRIRDEVLIG